MLLREHSKNYCWIERRDKEGAENCYGSNVQECDYQYRKRVQSCHDVMGKHFKQLMSSDNEAAHQTTSDDLKVKNVVSFLFREKVSSWIQFSRFFPPCLHHSLSVTLRSLKKHVTFVSCAFFLLPVFRLVYPYNIKNRIGWSYLCWSFKFVSFLFWKLSKFENDLWIMNHPVYRKRSTSPIAAKLR